MLAEGGDPSDCRPRSRHCSPRGWTLCPTRSARSSSARRSSAWTSNGRRSRELAPMRRRPPGARLAALVRKELIRPHEAIGDTFASATSSSATRPTSASRSSCAPTSRALRRLARRPRRGVRRDRRLSPRAGASLSRRSWGPRTEPRPRRSGRRSVSVRREAGLRPRATCRLLDLLGRAVAPLPDDDPGRLPLQPMLGRALIDRGEWERAAALLTRGGGARRRQRRPARWRRCLCRPRLFGSIRIRGRATPRFSSSSMRASASLRSPATSRARPRTQLAANVRYWRGERRARRGSRAAARYAREAGDVPRRQRASALELALAMGGDDGRRGCLAARGGCSTPNGRGRRPSAEVLARRGARSHAGRLDARAASSPRRKSLAEELGEHGVADVLRYRRCRATCRRRRSGRARSCAPTAKRSSKWATGVTSAASCRCWPTRCTRRGGSRKPPSRRARARARAWTRTRMPRSAFARVQAKLLALDGDLATAEQLAPERQWRWRRRPITSMRRRRRSRISRGAPRGRSARGGGRALEEAIVPRRTEGQHRQASQTLRARWPR